MAIEYDDELGQYVDTQTGEVVIIEPFVAEGLGLLGSVVGGAVGGPAGAALGGALGGAAGGWLEGDDEDGGGAASDVGSAIGGAIGGDTGAAVGGIVGDLAGGLFGGGGGSSQQQPSQRPTGARTYTIQPGDTLSAIAQMFGTTVQAIARANGIQNPDMIRAGETILIPQAQVAGPAPTQTGPFTPVGLTPTSQWPGSQPSQQSQCTYYGDGGWLCPPGSAPPNCGGNMTAEYRGRQTAQHGPLQGQQVDAYQCRSQQSQPQLPTLPVAYPGGPPAVPASPQFQPDLPDVDLPGVDLPDYMRAFAEQMLKYVMHLGASNARKLIEYLARRVGVKRGQGANMQAACIRELTKQLPTAKKDAVRQFLCEFPGPMNLSKDGEETFLALKIAASGYDADTVCPCDD